MLINQVCVSIGKSLRRAVAQTPLGTLPNPPPPPTPLLLPICMAWTKTSCLQNKGYKHRF